MKNLLFLALSTTLLFNTSCKNEKKEPVKAEEVKVETVATKQYIIDTENTEIQWTAYKTTDKIPVSGIFKEVEITNIKPGASPAGAIKGIKFSIPVNSIYSKDSIRDLKIVKSFFGSMKNTSSIVGKITLAPEGTSGNVTLKMNGINKIYECTYTADGNNIVVNMKLNLEMWGLKTAIKALNLVCKDKHKAADGKSVTWSEVDVVVNIKTKEVE